MGLEKIGEIRKQKGMSIEDLAARSGVPISTLSKISAGITKDPKLETVKAIAKALGCSLSDFDDGAVVQLPTELTVPENLKNVTFAFHRGEFEGLTQEEVDALAVVAATLKAQRKL